MPLEAEVQNTAENLCADPPLPAATLPRHRQCKLNGIRELWPGSMGIVTQVVPSVNSFGMKSNANRIRFV